ncbi:hypothetical protein F4803DRAFT_514715 [Xylaria telfairii]|nr:hypothetical protein F4803DRAFT_514715 [Xylaria telfairii]
MVYYQPLDTSRNEIRVIHLLPAGPSSAGISSIIECTLKHVSLDDYSEAYRTFLELDGAEKLPVNRALLWDLVTNQSTFIKQLQKDAPSGTPLGDALAGFSESPVYQRDIFRNATTYQWGDFYALSYEWGDPGDTDEIIVDGEKTTVTRNLKDTLQRLRTWWHEWDNTGSISLWVDALCINQADVVERNYQVRRMRQIYSTAIKVLIMSGPDVEDPQATSELLSKIFRATVQGYASPEGARTLLNEGNCSAWKGVCEIAGRSYWSRLWIIQEVLLANTGAWLCYGNKYCLVTVFFEAVSIVLENIYQARSVLAAPSEGASEDWLQHVDRVERFLYLNGFKRQGMAYPNLLTLLDTARKARQFDPRDKIYGLLGMVEDAIHVTPDYRLPLNEVYRDFVVEVIKTTGSLSIIYQRASSRTIIPSWPSWVPDWSADAVGDESESLAAIAYLDACAAGDSSHSYKIPATPNQLLCEGFMIDTVDQLACTGQLNVDHNIHDTIPQPPNQDSARAYQHPTAVRQAFWDALTLNRSVVIGEKAMAYLLGVPYFDRRAMRISFLHVIDRFQQCNRNLTVAHEPLHSYFPPWSESYSELPEDPEIRSTLGYLMNAMMHRRFAITERGRVGMVPRTARPGDNIFILKGCNAPLILRPAGNGAYSVVGECHVDGAMHGGAMGDLEAGRYEAKTIILC